MAYRKKTAEEKLAELREQERQLKERIRRENARIKSDERKRDTRRKIIAGALALEHKDESFQRTLQSLIQEYVTRPDERALFGLAPLPGDKDSASKETQVVVQGEFQGAAE